MKFGVVAEELSYRYQGGTGISGISFRAHPGEITCIYGKNGAGKSTLLNIISTYLRPWSGRFFVGGTDGTRNRDQARASVFPVFDESAHFDLSDGRENLAFFKMLYGLDRLQGTDELFKDLDLDLSIPAGSYSLGMKRKLLLAESLLCRKPVLLYDEPALGLDTATRDRVFSLFRERADEGVTVLYGTNRVSEVIYADRVMHLTGEGIQEVDAGGLKNDLIPVTITLPEQVVTEYLERIEELPRLVNNVLAIDIPKNIEIGQVPKSQRPFFAVDAEEKIRRAPPFVQPMIRKLVRAYAKEKGYTMITGSVVDEAKQRFEQR